MQYAHARRCKLVLFIVLLLVVYLNEWSRHEEIVLRLLKAYLGMLHNKGVLKEKDLAYFTRRRCDKEVGKRKASLSFSESNQDS